MLGSLGGLISRVHSRLFTSIRLPHTSIDRFRREDGDQLGSFSWNDKEGAENEDDQEDLAQCSWEGIFITKR